VGWLAASAALPLLADLSLFQTGGVLGRAALPPWRNAECRA